MMTYVPEEKTLFSADAFGSFGVYSNYAAHWIDEARRYYINICGKYGAQVSAALAKIEALDILNIAPLHGCVLEGAQLTEARRLYGIWSKYEVEHEGVLVAYASIHGNTSKVAQNIAETLRTNGMKVKEIDLCRTDVSEAVAQAFCYGKMVLCASSYDAGVFPPMHVFLYKLGIKGYQSRQVALVENGSWAPSAGKTMRGMLEAMNFAALIPLAIGLLVPFILVAKPINYLLSKKPSQMYHAIFGIVVGTTLPILLYKMDFSALFLPKIGFLVLGFAVAWVLDLMSRKYA
jgi:flavorubredoxin